MVTTYFSLVMVHLNTTQANATPVPSHELPPRPSSHSAFGLTMLSMIEYRNTPPIPIPQPMSFMGSRLSPRTRATPTITMTRFAVLATD